MGGKPEYKARWEPDGAIADQPDLGDLGD